MKRNENYVFVSINQFAKILSKFPIFKEVYFTVGDDPDLVLLGATPEGWYCAKRTRIFDETNGVLAIGYLGGGHTSVYEVYTELTRKQSEDLIGDYLQDFLLSEVITFTGEEEFICLEITDENRDIINKSLEEHL